MEQDKKEEPKRAWINGKEVGGVGPYELVDTPSGRYLKHGSQYHKVERKSWGATGIEGLGTVERTGGQITGIKNDKGEIMKVRGDLGSILDK